MFQVATLKCTGKLDSVDGGERQRLIGVDRSTLSGDVEDVGIVALPPECCSVEVCIICSLNDGIFSFEVDVCERRCKELHLMVNKERFCDRMQKNGFPSEEYVLRFCRKAWRELILPVPRCTIDTGNDESTCSTWTQRVLSDAQERVVRWMHDVEQSVQTPLHFNDDLEIADGWYLNTHEEHFTRKPQERNVFVKGAVCTDQYGIGKTALVMRLVAESTRESMVDSPWPTRYASPGTLIIVPLNLLSEWIKEATLACNAVKVVVLSSARHLKDVSMSTLRDAHAVVTTFPFLLSCPSYTEMVESALGGKPRSRAALSCWTKQVHHKQPLIEAVWWRRIVIDEIQHCKYELRTIKHVKMLRGAMFWGLTSFPSMVDDQLLQDVFFTGDATVKNHPVMMQSFRKRAFTPHFKTCSFVMSVQDDWLNALNAMQFHPFQEGEHLVELFHFVKTVPLGAVVIFTEERSDVREVVTWLRRNKIAARTLDGNSTGRCSALQELDDGGVLILALSSEIAGLRLDSGKHVVFLHKTNRMSLTRIEHLALHCCVGKDATPNIHCFFLQSEE